MQQYHNSWALGRANTNQEAWRLDAAHVPVLDIIPGRAPKQQSK